MVAIIFIRPQKQAASNSPGGKNRSENPEGTAGWGFQYHSAILRKNRSNASKDLRRSAFRGESGKTTIDHVFWASADSAVGS
jgi:hypothetical protein